MSDKRYNNEWERTYAVRQQRPPQQGSSGGSSGGSGSGSGCMLLAGLMAGAGLVSAYLGAKYGIPT